MRRFPSQSLAARRVAKHDAEARRVVEDAKLPRCCWVDGVDGPMVLRAELPCRVPARVFARVSGVVRPYCAVHAVHVEQAHRALPPGTLVRATRAEYEAAQVIAALAAGGSG